MKDINEILTLTDEIEIIEAVGTKIWDKKEEADDFATLSEGEHNFVLIDIFEGAMSEGGLLYFFENEAGDYAKEVIDAYQAINAVNTAKLISKAIGLFGIKGYSSDFEKRVQKIATLDEHVFSGWEDLDEIFFNDEQEEDVVTLIVNYIKENKNWF